MHIFKALDDYCPQERLCWFEFSPAARWSALFLACFYVYFHRRSITTPSLHPYRELLHDLEQWFSKCGPKNGNISFSWELGRNSLSLASPQTEIRRSEGWGVVQQLCFNKPSRGCWCILMLEKHCFEAALSNRNNMQVTYIILNALIAT